MATDRKPVAKTAKCERCGSMTTPQGMRLHLAHCKGGSPDSPPPDDPPDSPGPVAKERKPSGGGILSRDGLL